MLGNNASEPYNGIPMPPKAFRMQMFTQRKILGCLLLPNKHSVAGTINRILVPRHQPSDPHKISAHPFSDN
jgi:hypothetical protein